jgi:hypothetical protein
MQRRKTSGLQELQGRHHHWEEMLAKSESERIMGVATLRKWESRRSGHSQ